MRWDEDFDEGTSEDAGLVWWCEECDRVNPLGAAHCEGCGLEGPEGYEIAAFEEMTM